MKTSIILLIIFFCIPAFAYSQTTWYVDGTNTSGPWDGTQANPFQYIQDGIVAATNGDTVLVLPFTYVENIDFIGKAITVISDKGPGVTVIDGGQPVNPNFGSVVTFQTAEGPSSVLEGFTITNGLGTWTIWQTHQGYTGGGIYCNGASPLIRGNIVTDNETRPGIKGWAGGIICLSHASPEIVDNIISGNSTSHYGGGISVWDNGSPLISGNLIENNTADWGGGVFLFYYGTPMVINNRFIKNTARKSMGGVHTAKYCDAIISNNLILENEAKGAPLDQGFGGGMGCENSSPTVTSNVFCRNKGNHSGGAISVMKAAASPNITNNVFMGNSANDNGGAIDCHISSSPLITNCTFYGNSAMNGGGISCRLNSHGKITDCILWNDRAGKGDEIYIGIYNSLPSTVTISYSDVEGGKANVFVGPGCTLNWDSGMIDADPHLIQGPSGFYYLSQDPCQPGINSPCVDTGSGLASNLGMDIYWTRTDEIPDSGMVDMGFHYGDFTFSALQTNNFMISEASGGKADFLLLAGSGYASRNYILLGSVTGIDPGTPLPGGAATLPLNWDVFTSLVVDLLNSPIFSNFMGTLDGTGSAKATFDTLGPILGAQGLTMHFAYALNNPWNFVSNPVGIEILP